MDSKQLICIIDDSPDYLFLLRHVFRSSLPVYSVRFFTNGDTFLLDLPQMHPKPRLILLDRHMPTLDGHQVLVRLKQNDYSKTIPVVMMSALATAEEIKGCYEAGASLFTIKELDVNQLREELLAICQQFVDLNYLPSGSHL